MYNSAFSTMKNRDDGLMRWEVAAVGGWCGEEFDAEGMQLVLGEV